MVFTRYHHPVDKDKILLGDVTQYESAMASVAGFKQFILQICSQLEGYSVQQLTSAGIECSRNARDRYYEIRVNGSILRLGIDRYTGGMHFSATQYGNLDILVDRITNGVVSASMRVLDFEAKDFMVGRNTQEHHFSFGFEDTNIKGEQVGTYIEACLPHPVGKIIYDADAGRYKVVYKEKDEKPMVEYDSVYTEYYNADGTEYKSEPFVSTTYDSFECAITDIQTKTELFKNVWELALQILRENTNQNDATHQNKL